MARPRPPAAAPYLARLFHALSDETRLKLLECLEGGEECVCNLTDLLDAGQSRLSFHLKTMKDAGLVRDRKDGRWVHYSLDPGAVARLEAFVDRLKRSASCCETLPSLPTKAARRP